jgi:hypothetical protein
LWERWLREAKTGEGFVSAAKDPSSGADFVRATFSHKGRGGFSKPGFFLFYINVLLSYQV